MTRIIQLKHFYECGTMPTLTMRPADDFFVSGSLMSRHSNWLSRTTILYALRSWGLMVIYASIINYIYLRHKITSSNLGTSNAPSYVTVAAHLHAILTIVSSTLEYEVEQNFAYGRARWEVLRAHMVGMIH